MYICCIYMYLYMYIYIYIYVCVHRLPPTLARGGASAAERFQISCAASEQRGNDPHDLIFVH